MSTSKLDRSGAFQAVTVHTQQTKLVLASGQVAIRKNGIEFFSPHAIPEWTEVTVDLRSPGDSGPVRGHGVVVDCAGNRHAGYIVSLVFMNLTRQSQERLSQLAVLPPA